MTSLRERAARPAITTVRVRASDLLDDDFIVLENQWRVVVGVYRRSEDIAAMITETLREAFEEEVGSVRLDAAQGGRSGVLTHSPTPRPGPAPVIIVRDSVIVTTNHPEKHTTGTVRAEALVAALLNTEEYIAVRWIREEASDGSCIDDAWAVFKQWDLVEVQKEEGVTA